MLNIVYGRSGYGKTEYVFNSIKTFVLEKNENVLLITPEQYSFIAERRLLTELGESDIYKVCNASFSRIYDNVAQEYGYKNLKVLTQGSKAILMLQAIEQCKDEFLLFHKNIDSLSFVNSMIKIYDEMRSCNLDGNMIADMSKNIENIALFNKMHDIALIMNCYDKIIENRFIDPADELTMLYRRIKDKQYFKNKNVVIDGFNGFVAQEYKILELVISEANEVIITLCSDNIDNDDSFGLFAYVNNSAKIIEKIAKKAGVHVNRTELNINHRTDNIALKAIEKGFFSKAESVENSGSVSLYAATSVSDECRQASRQIRTLLRQGYRASEIAIITRNIDKYRDELSYCFRKYDIPFFYDERQPIKSQPVVVFIEYLFRCINFSLRSDDILCLAKTGLTNIAESDINELENYVYMWNINGSKWKRPFENSPRGISGEVTESERNVLDNINKTREAVIAPILSFKNAASDADAKTICEQIYKTLIKFGADEKIRQYALHLSEMNMHALAIQQGTVWDIVMNVLDSMADIMPSETISINEFSNLFSLVINTEDMGSLPTGLDNVQFGQADRIRTDNPKAVIILGANEGEFPQSVNGGGLLTESDRRILLDNDFKLYSYGELLNIQERYFAYMSCTAATEKLFVSYISSGKDNAPSEIVATLQDSIKELTATSVADLNDIDFIETKSNAFDLMSEHYLTNTPFYSSLKKYFEDDERFSAIQALAENCDNGQLTEQNATALYDKNIYVSASRIEDYYNCPFRYFCKFGVSAKPRVKAEIDPMQRGTLIHYVLETILSEYGCKRLTVMTKPEIRKIVDDIVVEYMLQNIGNASEISVRFEYNYKRLAKLIYSVVYRLAEEFKNCDFEAKAFELDIDRDGSVKPEILTLKNGGTIQVRGSIDRVDTYTVNGKTFVRVVDYKSGNKTFNLSDILYGLNLQMFIYLFTLCEDKDADFTGIPAGVLYMHAAREIMSFDSKNCAQTQVEAQESSSFKMKGLIIDEDNGEIALAMEHELSGKYIPVKFSSKGELSGSIASLAEFGMIHRKVNALIIQMGNDLHKGVISRNPVKNKNHKSTCDYCDYADVCANMRNIEFRITPDITDAEVKNLLEKEYADDEA